jgi:hypothetical protein
MAQDLFYLFGREEGAFIIFIFRFFSYYSTICLKLGMVLINDSKFK